MTCARHTQTMIGTASAGRFTVNPLRMNYRVFSYDVASAIIRRAESM